MIGRVSLSPVANKAAGVGAFAFGVSMGTIRRRIEALWQGLKGRDAITPTPAEALLLNRIQGVVGSHKQRAVGKGWGGGDFLTGH